MTPIFRYNMLSIETQHSTVLSLTLFCAGVITGLKGFRTDLPPTIMPSARKSKLYGIMYRNTVPVLNEIVKIFIKKENAEKMS